MAYIEEFRSQIEKRDFSKMMQLWQEYCQGDQVDGQEILDILILIKNSDFAKSFGKYVEAILPLLLSIDEEAIKSSALTHLFDLQTTNSEALYQLAIDFVKTRYEKLPHYNDKLRLTGLRTRENFQGALTNFALLNHFQKGNYLYHTAGWGVGLITDCSFLREQLTIQFENLKGSKRDITFKNGFKTLQVLPSDHFLAMRYGANKLLEEMAKEDPARLVHHIIRDLGPKTGSEIKELLEGFVIDEEEYSKWWQGARAKIKKDPLIEKPEQAREPYRILSEEVSKEGLIEKALKNKKTVYERLVSLYSTIKEYPELLKQKESLEEAAAAVNQILESSSTPEERATTYLFLDVVLNKPNQENIIGELKKIPSLDSFIALTLEIQALKRRAIMIAKTALNNWVEIGSKLLIKIEPAQLKDVVLKELIASGHESAAEKALFDLFDSPELSPSTLLWFLQRQTDQDAPLLSDQASRERSFEALLVLLQKLEAARIRGLNPSSTKELIKKAVSFISDERYLNVRSILRHSSLQFSQELILLASKCHSFSEHDLKLIKSLVEVVHPPSKKVHNNQQEDINVFWTTPEGYEKVRKRIEQVGTVEVVENAKEIEAARALGDLRENSEYKFALEKRSRLQAELKQLSDQFNAARIITKEDIDVSKVGIGTRVTIESQKGEQATYSILGPWEADPDKMVLSIQSKFVQAMLGKKIEESFSFKEEEFKILRIESSL